MTEFLTFSKRHIKKAQELSLMNYQEEKDAMNHAISMLKFEGYNSLGVDFESFNPTASSFWLKHFTPYTNSVVRRIDECALFD